MRKILLLICLAFAGEARRLLKAEEHPESIPAAAFAAPSRISRHSARPSHSRLVRLLMQETYNKAWAQDLKSQVKSARQTLEAAAPEEPKPIAAPARSRLGPKAWNPQNVGVPKIPFVAEQFVPEYFKQSPPYLIGGAGGIGFDPCCLVALAKPSPEMIQTLGTAEARQKKMLSMSPAEQAENVAWMFDSELKHARLAMLAAAGWPMAELTNKELLSDLTKGRAPSLFNGHLLDYLPFLLVFFGGLSALEFLSKDKVNDGNFGFDPLGFSTGKGPIPFDAIPKEVRSFEPLGLSNVGNLEALKLAEIKNGRAAMMGITGFSVQEFFYGSPVVDQTPFFFHVSFAALSALTLYAMFRPTIENTQAYDWQGPLK